MEYYEQKYNELAERYDKVLVAVKKLQEANSSDEGVQNWVNDFFPELAESEDERIRKALIKFHKSTIDIDGIKGGDILAWLERQAEQRPFAYENANIQQYDFAPKSAMEAIEDETIINNLVWAISNDCIRPQDREDYCDWLKSLRPQSKWKPSDAQMGALANACDGKMLNLDYLNSLYQDLKKLRHE